MRLCIEGRTLKENTCNSKNWKPQEGYVGQQNTFNMKVEEVILNFNRVTAEMG